MTQISMCPTWITNNSRKFQRNDRNSNRKFLHVVVRYIAASRNRYLHISDSLHIWFWERFRNLENKDVLGKTNQNNLNKITVNYICRDYIIARNRYKSLILTTISKHIEKKVFLEKWKEKPIKIPFFSVICYGCGM